MSKISKLTSNAFQESPGSFILMLYKNLENTINGNKIISDKELSNIISSIKIRQYEEPVIYNKAIEEYNYIKKLIGISEVLYLNTKLLLVKSENLQTILFASKIELDIREIIKEYNGKDIYFDQKILELIINNSYIKYDNLIKFIAINNLQNETIEEYNELIKNTEEFIDKFINEKQLEVIDSENQKERYITGYSIFNLESRYCFKDEYLRWLENIKRISYAYTLAKQTEIKELYSDILFIKKVLNIISDKQIVNLNKRINLQVQDLERSLERYNLFSDVLIDQFEYKHLKKDIYPLIIEFNKELFHINMDHDLFTENQKQIKNEILSIFNINLDKEN